MPEKKISIDQAGILFTEYNNLIRKIRVELTLVASKRNRFKIETLFPTPFVIDEEQGLSIQHLTSSKLHIYQHGKFKEKLDIYDAPIDLLLHALLIASSTVSNFTNNKF